MDLIELILSLSDKKDSIRKEDIACIIIKSSKDTTVGLKLEEEE